MRILIFILFLVLNINKFYSQNLVGNFSANINIGTHKKSIGININLGFQYSFLQLNINNLTSYIFSSYGNRKKFFENRSGIGLVILAGKKEQITNYLFSEVYHNTQYNYGLAYSYLWYYDNIGSSQRSGSWAIHLKKFSLTFENDVFAGQSRDRFRTGLLNANYHYLNYNFYGKIIIWTGETKNSFWDKTPIDGFPNGFRTLEHLPYGRTSHGIMCFGVKGLIYNQNYFQNFLQVECGIESEKIREYFQNKISHDLIFLPSNIKRNTPHYPMLNQEGCAVFNKKDRKKDQFYIQISTNENNY